MNKSEALTTFAALAVGRGIMRTAGSMAAPVVGSILTAHNLDPTGDEILSLGLQAINMALDGDDQQPITVSEFKAEVRRITNSTAISDAEALAHIEYATASAQVGGLSSAMKAGN